MPSDHIKKRCSATTQTGQKCRNWAMIGHDVCRVHRTDLPSMQRGAPKGNRYALKHGMQARILSSDDIVAMAETGDSDSLDEEIAYLRVVIRRLMDMLEQAESKEQVFSWSRVLFDGISRLGSLVKARKSLAPEPKSADEIMHEAINTALDELSEEWGIEL